MVKIGELFYQTTSDGFLLKRRGTGLIKTYLDNDGYLKYHLSQYSKTFNIYVHQVIYIVHYGEITKGMTVDHKDNDKLNNFIVNLQLLTAEENSIKGNAKLWTMMDPTGKKVEIYNMEEFCRVNHLHASHMRSVANGEKFYIQHKGWTKCT